MTRIKTAAELIAAYSASITFTSQSVATFVNNVFPLIECAFLKRGETQFRIGRPFINRQEIEDEAVYSFTMAQLETEFSSRGYVTVLSGTAPNRVLFITNPIAG